MDEKTMSRADVAKRLRILFYLAFAGLVPPLMCLAPQLLVAADWAALAVSVANAAVLLSLAAAGKRYRSAGLLAVIAAVCSLLVPMFISLGLQIVYIIYLNRTCRLLESGEA